MQPLNAPVVVQQGLAYFVLVDDAQAGYPLSGQLSHSEFQGPVQKALSPCPDKLLATYDEMATLPHTLLLYEEELQEGYYTLRLWCPTPTRVYKAELTLGVLQGDTYKVIGSPYSIYSPIELI